MRCHQARQRLSASRGIIGQTDDDLKRHLEECAACAAAARSERALQRDFQSVMIDDNIDDLPLAVLKTRVEARVSAADHKEDSVMSAFAKTLTKRPRLSFTLGAALIVLLVVALIPFEFEQTIGYQVAFAGVDRDLAMDHEKIELLLETLGCEGAVADVTDCEATCRLTISLLDSQNDVKIVRAAFSEMGDCVLVGVGEINAERSTTVLRYARELAFRVRPPGDAEDEAAVNQFVIGKLEFLSGDSAPFNIFVTSFGEGDTSVINIDLGVVCDSNMFFGDSIMLRECVPGCAPGKGGGMIRIDESVDGARQAIVVDEEGNRQVFDLSNAEDIERMNALGLQLDMLTQGGCGGQQIICRNLQLVDEDEKEGDDAAGKESSEPEFPEGFSLAQNYPNPFNPTTTISYRLPESRRVTLDIYNLTGQRVATLVDGVQSAGEHTIEWNSTDNAGNRVASGVYIYRLEAGDFIASKKMTLVK